MMHVMESYSHCGHHDFIVACGYKCLLIKSFFQDLHLMNNDFTVALKSGGMTLRPTGKIDWNVSVVDTGQTTMRPRPRTDRKSFVQGKIVSVRVDHGGRRILKKQNI